jgi:hypothetical protein
MKLNLTWIMLPGGVSRVWLGGGGKGQHFSLFSSTATSADRSVPVVPIIYGPRVVSAP